MDINYWHYDGQTGRLLGEDIAQPGPIDGAPLIPANATTIEPPVAVEGKDRVFKDGAWAYEDIQAVVVPAAPTLGELKVARETALHAQCYADLSATDWQIIRHAEQVSAGVATSLTVEQFAALSAARQALRDKYHTLAAQVDAATDTAAVSEVTW